MTDILKRVEELSDLIDNKGSERLEFNLGGRIELRKGNPPGVQMVNKPEKIKFVKDLAKTKKYSITEIKKLFKEKYGNQPRHGFFTKAAEGIELPSGAAKSFEAQSISKSKYLKDYTYQDLEADLKIGKPREQIVKELLEKNKDYYKTIKPSSYGLRYDIRSAINSRIIKKPELGKIEKSFAQELLKKSKIALADIKNFITKNKETYKKVYQSNKIGALENFKEKVLDYASQKYPDLVKRSKGLRDLLTGQRIFEPYSLVGPRIIKQGEYGRDVELNRDIRRALGIPEKPLAGEGSKTNLRTNYNKDLNNLLKKAQKLGIIPKVDPTTGNLIKDGDAYYRYIERSQIDPIRNLFGKNFNFGQEHLGGMARARIIEDPQSLARITAMDPIQNKFVKGTNFDTKITTLINLAKESSPEKAKGYIESANKIVKEADKKFGLEGTKYKVKGNKIIPIQPKVSLEDSLFKKAQRAIKSFVATKRFKDPKFKELPEPLRKSINALRQGNQTLSNKFLREATKAFGPTLGMNVGLINYFDDVKTSPTALGKVGKVGGKLLGPFGLALEGYFMKQAYDEGRTIPEVLAKPFMLEGVVSDAQERLRMTMPERQAVNRAQIADDFSDLDTDFLTPIIPGSFNVDVDAVRQRVGAEEEAARKLRALQRSGLKEQSKAEVESPLYAAGGGIAGLSGGIDMGPQVESMNPDSQGLQGIMKRGIKT